MGSEYYYRIAETEFGPLSFSTLALHIADRTLADDVMVRRADESTFQPACDVIGLPQSVLRRRSAKITDASAAKRELRKSIALRSHSKHDSGMQPPTATHSLRYMRMAVSLVVANGVAFTLSRWSLREAQRFPGAASLEAGGRFVPFIGECGPVAFAVAVVGLLMITALLTWLLLAWLERWVFGRTS